MLTAMAVVALVVVAIVGGLMLLGALSLVTTAIREHATATAALAAATRRASLVHEQGVALARAQIEMNRQLVEAGKQRQTVVVAVAESSDNGLKH